MSAATKAKTKNYSEAHKLRLAELKPSERFGKGSWHAIPNSYFTVLPRKCTGFAQYFAVGYIWNRTYGAPGQPAWTKVSLSTLARLTGFVAQAFSPVLEEACESGLLERKEADGGGWLYRTVPETWEEAEPAERRKVCRAAAPAPDPESSPDETPDAPPQPSPPGASFELAHGKAAPPVVVSVALKGIDKPVDVRWQPHNLTGIPLLFATSVRAGVVRFTVSSAAMNGAANGGEYKAKRAPLLAPLQLCSEGGPSDKNQRLSSLRFALKSLLRSEFEKPLDEAFFQLVAEKLGPEVPPEEFDAHVRREIAEMRRKRKAVAAGILVHFAEQARFVWDENASARRAVDQIRASQISRLKALGLTEPAALGQIERWQRAGWDVEAALREAETSAAATSLPEGGAR